MGKKSSTTVVVRRIKRHRAPGHSAPPVRVSHYGNGANGELPRIRKQQQSQSNSQTK